MKWSEIFIQATIIFSIILIILPSILKSKRLSLMLKYLIGISLSMAIIFRGIQTKRFPIINLYESIIFLVWGIILLSIIFHKKLPLVETIITGLINVALLGAATLLPPWEKAPHYLIPALQSWWLYIHVTTSFLSYSGFTIAAIFAFLYLLQKDKNKRRIIDEISYKLITVSFPLLSLGIITGAIWAHYAWGRYWSWDPKETWSLITWIIYAGYLHARITKGWSGRKTAWWLILGFMATVFTFLGVNYLLPGLHSYL